MIDALAFLTILPVGPRTTSRPPGPRTLIAFPVVGLLVGAVWMGAGWAGFRLWGALAAAGVITLADAVLTGGLHLDAVADLADGWASRKAPEGALAVMRDPAIGAVGAAVLVASLLTRWSLLAVLVAQAAAGGHWGLMLVAPVAGRAAMVWALGRSQPPWAATAGGAPAGASRSLTDAFLAPGPWILAAAALLAAAAGLSAGGARGLGAILLGGFLAEVFARWSRHRFGRLPGDAVGAVGIAAEILALGLLSAHP